MLTFTHSHTVHQPRAWFVAAAVCEKISAITQRKEKRLNLRCEFTSGHQQSVFNYRQQHLTSLFQLYSQKISGSNEVSVSSKGIQHILSGGFETEEQKAPLAVWYSESALTPSASLFSKLFFIEKCLSQLFKRMSVSSVTS